MSALAALRARVEEALAAALPPEESWPPTIHRAERYSLLGGGKRIRPLLALAAAEAVGGSAAAVMPFACAVEMIHTYSLVHDDLPCMDDDDLRRGQPTSHKVFGEAMAVLAGDALLTRAFHLLASAPLAGPGDAARRLQAIALLGHACGTTGLIGGQVMDLESEGRALAGADLERLHRAKTGALLTASVEGGALLAGAGEEALGSVRGFGRAIGLAFQVVDDVLDATGSHQQLGKTPGKDASAGKATYVSVHGLERARAMAAELQAEADQALLGLGARAALLRELGHLVVHRQG